MRTAAFFLLLIFMCRRLALRANRQATLNDQVHGAVDGNLHDAFIFIDPVVGGELAILILDELRSCVRSFSSRRGSGNACVSAGVTARGSALGATIGLMVVLLASSTVLRAW